jgi:hypothetical protein
VFSFEIFIELKIVSVLYLDSEETQVNQDEAIPTETQLVGGGAPDPPFWLLTVQLDTFWFLPIDSSSSYDYSWKQTVSSMLMEP